MKELVSHYDDYYWIDRKNRKVELLEWVEPEDENYELELRDGTRWKPSGKIVRCIKEEKYTDKVELIGLSCSYEINLITEVYNFFIITDK